MQGAAGAPAASNSFPGLALRLSEFINQQREPILVEWETFARRLGTVTEGMDIEALRDHASEMLTVIAADLETPQTDREQHQKAIGEAAEEPGDPATAAEEHGPARPAESRITGGKTRSAASASTRWCRSTGRCVPA